MKDYFLETNGKIKYSHNGFRKEEARWIQLCVYNM